MIDFKQSVAVSDFCQLTSLSLCLPSMELAKSLIDGSYKTDVITILGELDCKQEEIDGVILNLEACMKDKSEVNLFKDLRQEYTRLFTAPKQPVLWIYETLFLLDQQAKERPMLFMSPAALEAERCYNEAGFSITKECNEPADHLATELEFLMVLYAQKGHCIVEKNYEDLKDIREQIQQFEDKHAKKWWLDFFIELEKNAQHSFFQGVGQIGKHGITQFIKK